MDAAIFPHSSDTYNATGMFSFAMTTSTSVGGALKPGLLGIAPNIPTLAHLNQVCRTTQPTAAANPPDPLTPPYQQSTGVSSSSNHSDLSAHESPPPAPASADKDKSEHKNSSNNSATATLFQQLAAIEQSFANKTPVHISNLLSLCADKQVLFTGGMIYRKLFTKICPGTLLLLVGAAVCSVT